VDSSDWLFTVAKEGISQVAWKTNKDTLRRMGFAFLMGEVFFIIMNVL
jgi:hypothetical protein